MNCFWKESEKNSVKMGKLYKLLTPLFLVGFFFLCTSSVNYDLTNTFHANSNSLINLNRGLQAFGFRTQKQWNEITQQQIRPFYTDTISPGRECCVNYMIHPYWMGDQYDGYIFTRIKRIGYLGYMIDPSSGDAALTYSWTVNNILETKKHFKTAFDLVLFCSGKDETDQFLSSEKARTRCINKVMMYAFKRDSFPSNDKDVKTLYIADGINVFFPDFSFEKKREFGLFIKDLCWAYWNSKEVKKLDTAELILTFPMRDTIYRNYIDGLYKYVDEVYYADYDYRGMLKDTSSTMEYLRNYINGKNELNLVQKLVSEMRVAYIYNPFKKNSAKYGEDWEPYLIAICLILFLILATFITSLFWGRFNQIVTENRSIVFLVGALMLTEVLFLFIFMIEKMNYDIWLINTNNQWSNYFLSMPLILILVFPIIRLLQGQRQLP
jgi:hypothetical protein